MDMPNLIRALYQPPEQGWEPSELQILVHKPIQAVTDLKGSTGGLEEEQRSWHFHLRVQDQELQLCWEDAAYRQRPSRLLVEEPVQLGNYLERLDYGTDRVDEYQIVELRQL